MSVVVPVGLVPVGLRELSRVVLVVTPPTPGGVRPAPVLVEAVVASVPRNFGEVVGSTDAGQGMVALAVEVSPRYVGVVGEAEAVSVGVLDGSAPFPSDQVEPTSEGLVAGGQSVSGAAGPPVAAAGAEVTNLDGPTTIPTVPPTTIGPQG